MSLNESTVEEAALEWFGELVPRAWEVGHGWQMAPGESAAERDSLGEVVLAGCFREAIQRPAGAGLPGLLSGELRVAGTPGGMESRA